MVRIVNVSIEKKNHTEAYIIYIQSAIACA